MIQIYSRHFVPVPGEKKHQTEHRIGRELLQKGLSDLYQIDCSLTELEDMLLIPDMGKPVIKDRPDIHFNISHCDGMVICGFSDRELGVDAELPTSFRPSILRRLFTQEERDFFDRIAPNELQQMEWMYRFWTLKESYIKCTGLGLRRELNSFSFTFEGEEAPYRITCSESDYSFSQLQTEDHYLIAVCSAHETAEFTLIED